MPETINAFVAMCILLTMSAAVLSIPFLMVWLEKREEDHRK